jgi:hypothetical protein
MTAPDDVARAGEIRALSSLPALGRLVSAPLVDVLLWGLSRADHADPVLGVLRAVRLDMELLTECVHVNADVMEAGLHAAARRLDVAIELLRRLHRGGEAAAKDGAP